MTVEELIEELRKMPPTSRVEVDAPEWIFGTFVSVKYEFGTTTICVDDSEDKE